MHGCSRRAGAPLPVELRKSRARPIVGGLDDGATAARYGNANIPFLALIDAEGRLRWSDNPGALIDWTLETLLGPKK